MTYEEFIAQGGTPYDWYNLPENGGSGSGGSGQAPGTPQFAPQQFGAEIPQQPDSQQPNTHGTGPAVDKDGNPVGTDYNSSYFADDSTAAALAKKYGGTVINAPLREAGGGTPGSPFQMPGANYIQMPNGAVVNAGQISQWESQGRTDLINNEISHAMPTTGTGEDSWYSQFAPQSAGLQAAAAAAAKKAAGGGTPGSTPTGAGGTTSNTNITGTRDNTWPGTTGANGSAANGGTGTTGTTGTGGVATPYGTTGSTYPAYTGGAQAAAEGGTGITNGILPGGYGVAAPGPMPYGTGAIGGTPTTFNLKDTNNVGDILQNDRNFAYGQGGELIANYGEGLAQFNQRGRSLGAVGDAAYANLLQNPGYTDQQTSDITDKSGLDALNWTDQMGKDNQFTDAERKASMGDPNAGLNTYNGQADNLRQDARNFQTGVNGVYDNGATDLNTAFGGMSQRLDDAIDPSQLGLSSEYNANYNFGPDQQQAMIEDAGRTVGQGTAAVTDQLQRQANAAGGNSPLALAASLDRQRQTGAVASADAMTKAKIQAAQLGLQTEQTKEQTRLGSAQDIATRRAQAATTAGQADIANQQFLTSGRAQAATTTGQAYLDEQNRIAEQQTNLATNADATSAQRAQALAQNRQTVNQANQAAQFTRGSYTDQAQSQRATQVAGAARADQTAARQDIRNEEQTAYNEGNSMMAGQLQAFGGVTGAGQSSEQNAIKSAQLPTTLDKVIGAGAGAAQGLGLKQGGIVDRPTLTHLGEDGPEIVIKLGGSGKMSYRRHNEVPAYA